MMLLYLIIHIRTKLCDIGKSFFFIGNDLHAVKIVICIMRCMKDIAIAIYDAIISVFDTVYVSSSI